MHQRFNLQMSTTNAAFEEAFEAELARALLVVAMKVEAGETSGRIRDVNGNSVGTWALDREED